MKLLKVIERNGHYSLVFDKLPKMTYEKINRDYVGTILNDNGDVAFCDYLKYSTYGGAFGDAELTLDMKDGTQEKIKSNWWDSYICEEFINIGIGDIDELEDCFVFKGTHVKKQILSDMLKEYIKTDKFYNSSEIRKWVKSYGEWFDLINDYNKNLMINKKGRIVNKYSKENEFKSFLICKYFEKYKKNVYILEIKYRDKLGIRRKVELNPKEVYIKSLNISEKEAWKLIEKNCHYTIYVSKK